MIDILYLYLRIQKFRMIVQGVISSKVLFT